VAHFGVDTTFFCPAEPSKREDDVLSVGALAAHKGFDFLIEALARIPRTARPPLRIVTNADSAEERAFLVEPASKSGVEVIIETMPKQTTLIERYCNSALVAYAPVLEPFGLVPLEAMACGTPVVGVAEGGVPETVVHGTTGFLTPREPTRFAERLQELLSKLELRDEMGHRARQHVVSHWTWDHSVRRIEAGLAGTAGVTP
jgi:glycosyltransferase involved in cell wall biosynthesis